MSSQVQRYKVLSAGILNLVLVMGIARFAWLGADSELADPAQPPKRARDSFQWGRARYGFVRGRCRNDEYSS